MADTSRQEGNVYIRQPDVEKLEQYKPGGYHPVAIGDSFHDDRYKVVHKLGFGGYSTIWLARDSQAPRYVALKILGATMSTANTEHRVLRKLQDSNSHHPGQQFIPKLLDYFSIDGPNGHHACIVMEPSGCTITVAKEESTNFMFPIESARSIAAQLVMGLAYVHSKNLCHGDLHPRNLLLVDPRLDRLSPGEIYENYDIGKVPIKRVDGKSPEPHAPRYAILPMAVDMPANEVVDPSVRISDFGTSFFLNVEKTPTLCTPIVYRPPEALFNEPTTLAADIWTLGLSLYEVLGERVLFEVSGVDPDLTFTEMVSTLGMPPGRWWDAWGKRSEFFQADGSWEQGGWEDKMYTPGSRPLHQRMWDMGRGETPDACQWDVEGGEMRALEEMLRGMLAWEPGERLTADQVLKSEFMVKWAITAWERQQKRVS